MDFAKAFCSYFETDFYSYRPFKAEDATEINYPEEWYKIYQQERYWEIDPVLAIQESPLFYWDTEPSLYNEVKEKEFLESARGFNIKSGLTIKLGGLFEQKGSLTFASCQGLDQMRKQHTSNMYNILAFCFILQRTEGLNDKVDALKTSFESYLGVLSPTREAHNIYLSKVLSYLSILEAKTGRLCLPADMRIYIQYLFLQLRSKITSLIKSAKY